MNSQIQDVTRNCHLELMPIGLYFIPNHVDTRRGKGVVLEWRGGRRDRTEDRDWRHVHKEIG